MSTSDERFLRVVGRRREPEPGSVPSARTRQAMAAMARYRTRAPKGIFVYASHEQANQDRERWLVDAIVASELSRTRPPR